MNDLANRRFTEQLNKEKDQRRAWAKHKQQQQIFDVADDEFKQLGQLRDTLNNVCAEPSRTGSSGDQPPSRRKQLVGLRNEVHAIRIAGPGASHARWC